MDCEHKRFKFNPFMGTATCQDCGARQLNGVWQPAVPPVLIPALRQYRHNSGGDELIHGFDLKLTCALVEQLQAPITNDTVVIYRYQHEGAPGQWFYESTGKYYNAEPVTLGQLLALIPPGGNLPSD